MSFKEKMYHEEQLAEIARLVKSVSHLQGAVVELGCWEGRSTVVLANACAPETLVAVDWWTGTLEGKPQDLGPLLPGVRDIFKTFQENVAAMTAGNVDVRRQDTAEFLSAWRWPVKFCHLDAGHTYPAVRSQIEAFIPLMVPGGVLCGDDYQHPPVARACQELLPEHTAGIRWLWVWTKPA